FLGGVERRAVSRQPAVPNNRHDRPRNSTARKRRGAASGRDAVAAPREIENEFAVQSGTVRYRPVTTIDAGHKKALALTIEVPVEEMARPAAPNGLRSGPASE